ncbi:MAG: rod shape-determining protein RodA [Bacteroidetes bacterium]|nr:rod shape-determining protein RodA [Bacteroidota bacterium]MBS1972742.1 rod shape-determining protein RodA [Bacteroidota bacterium]
MSQRNAGISKGIDWPLVWIWAILCCIGVSCIFAATYRDADNVIQAFISLKTDYSRQLLYVVMGGIIGIFILLTDSKFFTATANLGYALGIFLMLLVFPFHSRVKGTESIIRVGNLFQLQPAELCTIFVNLALAKYLSRIETDFYKTRSQLIAAAITLVPAMLSILQKETGLALVYFSFFLVMFREGLPSSVLIIGFSFAVLVVATLLVNPNLLALILTGIAIVAIYFLRKQIKKKQSVFFLIVGIWFVSVGVQRFVVPFIFDHVFKAYQVKRIYDAIGKDYVPKNAEAELEIEQKSGGRKKDNNYNVKQSKIAIGSGSIFGKGLLKGTQTRYDFVPEQSTDFIFCTIGEGFGFVGSLVFLGIYLLLLMRIVTIAERQRSTFSRCYAYGVASVYFFHIAVNVCMTIGLAPVVGIPLPFMSYGGTSLITFTIMLFVLIRLDADRQMVLR